MRERFDTVVIGAGQSGLAAGYLLKRAGRRFVILDSHQRVGDAWRNRWDSLTLFSPGQYNQLPGMPFPGMPQHFPGKDVMADYLETYAAHFELPVRCGVTVERLWSEDGRYLLSTSEAGAGIEADHVIVATSGRPRVPGFAADLDPEIRQMHSTRYRRPSKLAAGPTLLVGAGNTGAEIALDLARHAPAVRPILLSGRDVGQFPGTFPAQAPLRVWRLPWWLVDRVLTVDNRVGRAVMARMQRGGTVRVRASRRALDAAGVERVPRTAGVRGGKPVLDDGRVLDVANVVWCTGFIRDHGWVDLPAFDDAGRPRHHRGVVASAPGLYFVGIPYQYSVTSGIVGGAGRDAAHVVEHLIAHSDQGGRGRPPARPARRVRSQVLRIRPGAP